MDFKKAYNSNDIFRQRFIDGLQKVIISTLSALVPIIEDGWNQLANDAVDAYYNTYYPKKYLPRTYQLPLSYNIKVSLIGTSNGGCSIHVDGEDNPVIDGMNYYYSLVYKRTVSPGEMKSIVNYIDVEGRRPIPPWIFNSPYPSRYGPIEVDAEQFDLFVNGGSVQDLVDGDDVYDAVQYYVNNQLKRNIKAYMIAVKKVLNNV